MTTDTKRKPEDKIAEPPKKWRNWFVVVQPFVVRTTGQVRLPGEVFPGTDIHPSKEMAEQRAAECLSNPEYASGAGRARYLGAEPEPDAH
jgi:hypothetical protein